VGNRRPIGQLALVKTLGAAAGLEPKTVLVPRKAIVAAGGEVMGENLYFGLYFDMPPITEVVSKAERLLGLTPTEFEKGLGETYEWYLAGHQRPVIDYSFEDGLLAGDPND